MAQKMIATLEFSLSEGDVFEVVKRAEGAKVIMDQAVGEIRKAFPDVKVVFSTAQIRSASSGDGTSTGRRGRPPGSTNAARDAAAAAAAANGATPAGQSADPAAAAAAAHQVAAATQAAHGVQAG